LSSGSSIRKSIVETNGALTAMIGKQTPWRIDETNFKIVNMNW